jgi:hypothetical protein
VVVLLTNWVVPRCWLLQVDLLKIEVLKKLLHKLKVPKPLKRLLLGVLDPTVETRWGVDKVAQSELLQPGNTVLEGWKRRLRNPLQIEVEDLNLWGFQGHF